MRDARITKVEDELMALKRQTTPLTNPQVTAIIRNPQVTTRLNYRKKKSKT